MILKRPKLQFVALFTHACFDEVHVIRDLRRIVPGNDRRDKERNRNIRAGRRGVLASIEALPKATYPAVLKSIPLPPV